jgi:single-stranded-DNA-specific exonuclease
MDGMALGASAASFLGVERSVCGRRWRTREPDPGLAAAIAQRHGLPEIVGRLLAQRGIGSMKRPASGAAIADQLPDPSHLRDTGAVARLLRAVQQGEPIVVFGDYDVDGATSAALVALLRGGRRARPVYVPDRMREALAQCPRAAAPQSGRRGGRRHGRLRRHRACRSPPRRGRARRQLSSTIVTEPPLPPAPALINPTG